MLMADDAIIMTLLIGVPASFTESWPIPEHLPNGTKACYYACIVGMQAARRRRRWETKTLQTAELQTA